MKYYLIIEDYDETNAYIGSKPPTVKKIYQLIKGVSRAADWPAEAAFKFSKDRPEGINANDFVPNSLGLLIISGGFRSVLEELDSKDLEFLPIQLLDHKDRPVKGEFYIANFTKLHEVVDRRASVFEADPADPDAIQKFDKLVLKREIVDAGPAVLRMKEKYMLILVREDVVRRVREAGLTGMTFVDTQTYQTYPSKPV